jgi:hypothetical protein
MAKKSKTKNSKNKPRNNRGASSGKLKQSRRKSKLRKKRIPNKADHFPSDDRFETALKYLREGRSQKRAAELGMVSVNRFRRFLRVHKLAKRKGKRWIITDRRIREIPIISEEGLEQIRVRGFSAASLVMRHRAAVEQFLDTNDVALLAPFAGQTVTDASRHKHALETRPNHLYRLANAGSDADMKIYRLI